MREFIRSYLRDETGAAAAEYALILAIVGAGIAAAAFAPFSGTFFVDFRLTG